jgi:hypothetical protein
VVKPAGPVTVSVIGSVAVVTTALEELSSSTVIAEPPLPPAVNGVAGSVPKTSFAGATRTVKLPVVEAVAE